MKEKKLVIWSLALALSMLLCLFPAAAQGDSPQAQADAYSKHSLGLEGVVNARDMGGYPTADGRTIRFGKLFRSGDLTDITEQDIRKLVEEYHLVKDIDFRAYRSLLTDGTDPKLGDAEYCHYPYSPEIQFLLDGKAVQNLPEHLQTLAALDRNGTLIHDVYLDGYREFIETQAGIQMIRGFFRELLDAEGGAVLWHCVNGADRAGTATMLLLTVLGVDRDVIIADYLLTNDYLAEEKQKIYDRAFEITGNEKTAEDLSLLKGVCRDWIEMAYETMESNYGSADDYLHDAIGLTDEDYRTLQTMYLTGPSNGETKKLPFTDVAGSSWYYPYVRDAYEAGLMAGTSKTRFSPKSAVTRAQFAAVLYRIAGASDAAAGPVPFTDVPKDFWANPFIRWAYKNGFTAGTSETTYSPNAPITRQQLALMLYRLAGSPGDAGSLCACSDSEEVGRNYRQAVAWVIRTGIMTGYEDGTFRPADSVTRAQMAAIALAYRDLR